MPIAAVALALAALAAAGPPHQPRTKAGVIAAERAWVAALRRRDAATLDRLLAADFVDTTWKGERRAKPQVLAALSSRGSQPIELGDLTVSLHGDTAVARGLNTVRAPDGTARARIRFTDVFLYRDGAWRAVAAQETLEQPGRQVW